MVKYYDMTSITEQVKDMTRLELDSIMNNNNYIYDTKDFEERFRQFTNLLVGIKISTSLASFRNETKCNNDSATYISMLPSQGRGQRFQQATHRNAGAH